MTQVPFAVVFFELKDACDSLGSVSGVLALLDRVTDNYNKFYREVNKVMNTNTNTIAGRSTNKSNKSQTHSNSTNSIPHLHLHLDELRACAVEEVAWQGNASAFFDRASAATGPLSGYADVTSPVLSALQHISSGLRLSCGVSLAQAEDSYESYESYTEGTVTKRDVYKKGGKKRGNNKNTQSASISTCGLTPDGSDSGVIDSAKVWEAILQYPHSCSINLHDSARNGDIENMTRQALLPIDTLLRGRERVIRRATRQLTYARDAQTKGGNNAAKYVYV